MTVLVKVAVMVGVRLISGEVEFPLQPISNKALTIKSTGIPEMNLLVNVIFILAGSDPVDPHPFNAQAIHRFHFKNYAVLEVLISVAQPGYAPNLTDQVTGNGVEIWIIQA